MPSYVKFNGPSFDRLWVNNYGNITFDAPLSRPGSDMVMSLTSPSGRVIDRCSSAIDVQHVVIRDNADGGRITPGHVRVRPVTIKGNSMSQERTTGRREGWVGTVLWALLVVASITLMSIGLLRALFFGFIPEPALVEDARVGGLFILAGAVASLGAAVWSALRGDPRWVTAFVAAPAVLIGGIALFAPYSLLRHFAAVAAFPLALAGLIGGLPSKSPRAI